jgi:hypothetical protein
MSELSPRETNASLPETTLGPLRLIMSDDLGGIFRDARDQLWRFKTQERLWAPLTIEEASCLHMQSDVLVREERTFTNIWKASAYLMRREFERMLLICKKILQEQRERPPDKQDKQQIRDCEGIIKFYDELIPLLREVENADEKRLPKAIAILETKLKEFDEWNKLD